MTTLDYVGIVEFVPRPLGHWINRDAWDDVVELSGRSLTEIAEAADVTRTTLSCIVTGKDRASVEMAHRIAKGARCRVLTLFPTLDPTSALRAAS